jgi:hypothetical protein
MKIENLTGTLCGIVISVVAIWYAKHLGLVSVGYLGSCDAKDMLLMGGSIVLITYKKIFFPRKKERNIKNGQ